MCGKKRKTGRPICNAIVWQCRRTSKMCEELIESGSGEYIEETTGLRPDAYFSGTKLKWILDKYDPDRARSKNGELLFGTIDTWLLWKLTDGKAHLTDGTNASRTMLYSLKTGDWDDKLLELLDIPRAMLPEIRSSSEVFGCANVMGANIPICGIAGDQQAALFGQGCFSAATPKPPTERAAFCLNTQEKNPSAAKTD